jgi:hypothetical protein
MDKTPFSKCEILSDLYNDFFGTPEWEDFFLKNDLGIFCAVSFVAGSTTLTDIGERDVVATYNALCETLGVDKDFSFSTINEMLA